MNLHKYVWSLSLIALWGSTSSFINLGVSCDSNDPSCCQNKPKMMEEQPAVQPTTAITEMTSSNQMPSKMRSTKKSQECAYGGFILFADALYWIANQPSLSFAAITSDDSDFNTGGNIQNPSFNWEWGFRLGAGFNIPHGNWDSFVSYTWFQDNAEGSVSGKEGQTILPSLISAASNIRLNPITNIFEIERPRVSKASSKWNLFLNIVDWELGKTFIPSRYFSFRPYAGAKAVWIEQENNVRYDGYKTRSREGSYHTTLKDNYWGVGPRAGFNSQFWLGKGFSIYGNTGISLVLGEFNLSTKEKIERSQDSKNLVNISSNYYAGRAITDLQLGFRWDSNVCKTKKAVLCKCPSEAKKTNFSIALGWEQHMFFSQGQFIRAVDPTNQANFILNSSSLSVQGATGSLRFDF